MEENEFSNAAVLLVCNDADRAVSVGGLAYSHILDPIGERLASRAITVHSAPSSWKARLTRQAAFNEPLKFTIIQQIVLIADSVISRFAPNPGNYLSSLVWRGLLKKLSVRVVLGVQPGPGLCRAGRFLDIQVIDVQHGQINLKSNYYSRLRKAHDRKCMPSQILCWDDVSLRFVHEHLAVSAAVIGHPALALGLPEGAQATLAGFFEERLSGTSPRPRVNVIVIDTWAATREAERVRRRYLEEVAALMNTQLDVLWIIRAHPVRLRTNWLATLREYNELFGDHATVMDYQTAAEAPLVSILDYVDGMIVRGSGSLIEASYLGIPTASLAEREELERFFAPEHLEPVTWLGSAACQAEEWISRLVRRDQAGADERARHCRRMDDWLDELVEETLLIRVVE